jgi:enoyl-CoA hydratase/carnithine racemase
MNNNESHSIVVARKGPAVELKLSRPEYANAYTQGMLAFLEEQIDLADRDSDVRVMVITGEGDRVFCAGADREEIETRNWRSVLTLTSARVFRRLRQSRCVTMAAINGSAVGGGLELALSCDLRFAVPQARFWLPEPELGLIPAAGGTELLPQLVGPAKAKEMILGGATWDAPEALRIGLLNEIVPVGEMPDRLQLWIDRIVKRDADAVRFAKQAIDHGVEGRGGTGIELIMQANLVRSQRKKSAES